MCPTDGAGVDELGGFVRAAPHAEALFPSDGFAEQPGLSTSLPHLEALRPPAPEPCPPPGATIDTFDIGAGTIARLRCPPHVSLAAHTILPEAARDCFCLHYVLAGEIAAEHDGRRSIAGTGDILVTDGGEPMTLTMRGPLSHELIILVIPKQHYAAIPKPDTRLGDRLLTRATAPDPIFACLALIAEHAIGSRASPRDKLAALFQACVPLLPLAAGCYDDDGTEDEPAPGRGHYLLPRILKHIHQNISDPELCPERVARHFAVSVSYLHRIFAATGSTFRAYVVARRLHLVRHEMTATPRARRIAALARKWGFDDISVFNKAFRREFGCAPSRLRQEELR